MTRRIIRIDEEKCNGCGACVAACHEGAIEMIDGKANLVHENYCDGLGDCLPACPTGAITFEHHDAADHDGETACRVKMQKSRAKGTGGCPGMQPRLHVSDSIQPIDKMAAAPSRLMQWPCQIKLVPAHAPYFDGANLLIAADCTAYAYGNFHHEFMRNHITLIGCPKLDEGDYTEKLTRIIADNDIKSLKVVRMEVPCCGGIETAVKRALRDSGRFIPWQVVTISTDGKILN